MQARLIEAEEAVATCMIEAGFSYSIPVIGVQAPQETSIDFVAHSAAWIEKYGLGITTRYFSQSEVGDGLIGAPDTTLEAAEPPAENSPDDQPEMSETERIAYDVALEGAGNSDGCSTKRDDAFSASASTQSFYETFGDRLADINERARSDQRWIDFENAVFACMAQHGIDWRLAQRPQERFSVDLEDIALSIVAANPTPPEPGEPVIIADEDRRRLAQLQTEEIETAQLLADCGGGRVQEEFVLQSIRNELEREFLETHAAELSSFSAE